MCINKCCNYSKYFATFVFYALIDIFQHINGKQVFFKHALVNLQILEINKENCKNILKTF